jgi:hypothetical protein
VEEKNAMALASAHEDAEGLAWKVALLEDDLVAERRAREASEREHRAHLKGLTLLQTQGSKLCHAIIGPPRVKLHLSEAMWLATLRHIEMVGELTAFWAAVSSAMELVLGRLLGDTARVEVVGELVTEFHKVKG